MGFGLHPRIRNLTAFNSILGRFEWLCTPMGLQPASGHFQRFMEEGTPDPGQDLPGTPLASQAGPVKYKPPLAQAHNSTSQI